MSFVRKSAISALALATALAAQSANAQSFRVEGQAGVSQFSSEGNHKSKVGYGAAAGVDFNLGGGLVAGAEGTFWDSRAENRTFDGPGLAEHKTFQEYGIAARLGYLVTPSTLIYGKVGYVRNEQRKRFTPINPRNGQLDSLYPGAYYDHYNVSGIQYGAGIEQMVYGPVYVSAEARYSNYKNHLGGTHTTTGLLGLGVRFGDLVAVAPPPPAPAAPAAASGDADLPGRQRDPGDERLPAAAAAAPAASATAG